MTRHDALRGGIVALTCVLALRLAGCSLGMGLPSGPLRVQDSLDEGEALAFSHAAGLSAFKVHVVDSGGIRAVSEGKMADIGPVWSPDGSRLAYLSQYAGDYRLYLVDADGSNRREIAADSLPKSRVRWSPDGRLLAYVGSLPAPENQPSLLALWVVDAQSGEAHPLPVSGVLDYVWLQDGPSLLALWQDADSALAQVFDTDGNSLRPATNMDFLQDAYPVALSPDGTRVAYVLSAANPDEVLVDPLYVARLDGSDARQVGTFWMDGCVVWSPDGTRLAFETLDDDSRTALWIVRADGSDARQLLVMDTGDESGEVLPGAPAWSPDGQRLAVPSFVSAAGSAIIVVNADGTNRRQITTASGLIYDLAWRP